MTGSRAKIASNGFSPGELLAFRRTYKQIKQVYHPRMTSMLGIEEVIVEEARKALSLIPYYLLAATISAFLAIAVGRPDYLFMPAAFLILTASDILSSAKGAGRSLCCQLKLIKLAIRTRLH
ncbi:hypothetical protein B5M10_25625 [Pluralibacter gergoviae]|uniref:hypothetical protein n=1 Tax=Pluralibacter gergoviae TaxID=61647 RepID=UPI0005ECD206|nr:hypothetical protein [Pluralibacter gergoviae]KJM57539.1 hypothetical protein SS31_22455 [Pluralibacter gergoviae]OUQ90807.1 hypothetical protein B5M10_25625 [Pluralibacter gergoviae]